MLKYLVSETFEKQLLRHSHRYRECVSVVNRTEVQANGLLRFDCVVFGIVAEVGVTFGCGMSASLDCGL